MLERVFGLICVIPKCFEKNEKGKKTKETLEQAAYQEFMQKCTFHPEVSVLFYFYH
jgi:hypothetical protein